MNQTVLAVAAALFVSSPMVFADEVPDAAAQPPRDHIDSTVVGSNKPVDSLAPPDTRIADNSHEFKAGAPDIRKVTDQLNLSAEQRSQVHDAIERADAGAAVLINREHDVKEMIAATTPQDPMYSKLIREQAGEDDRWAENRDGLRREVMAILTPAQRARFEQLNASR